ncbi:MAG: VOC family protein [Flavobacteriales bacterium]|nr:VOC family protein [Flavobacteriales bacterium]HRP61575.1 VOC family protein [Vicingus sp.]
MLNSLTPNLMVNDVEETIEYYTDILGFTLLKTVPEKGNPDWAMVKRNDVILMFQSAKSLKDELPKLKSQKPGGGLTFYIKVDRITELHEELVDNEVEIIADLESTFYDTIEFSIIDNNGYVLTFSEEK